MAQQPRHAISEALTASKAALETTPTLLGFQQAHAHLEQATTLALQAVSEIVVQEVEAAMRAAAAETSLEEIEAAVLRLTPGDSMVDKQRQLLGILNLWGRRVDTCQDVLLQERLRQQVSELRTLVAAGELASTSTAYNQLLQLWNQYHQTRVDAARQRAVKTYCAYLGTELDGQLQTSERQLRLLEPHYTLEGVDKTLDQIRLGRQRVAEANCLDQLVGLHGQALAASEQLFVTLIALQDITPEARLAAAEHSGVQAAVASARRLLTEPWPLRIVVRSGTEERYVGRRVTLEVNDLHPGWGPGVTLAIDFDDHSPPASKSADLWRQEPLLVHQYKHARRFTVRVTAAEQFAADWQNS